MSYERGEAMERAQDRADEDRVAAEALAAALRALLSELPRCERSGCDRVASRDVQEHGGYIDQVGVLEHPTASGVERIRPGSYFRESTVDPLQFYPDRIILSLVDGAVTPAQQGETP